MQANENLHRCSWVNLKNKTYVEYHDEQWGVPVYDDALLFEMLILELFQAGLSWECVLNKREAFRKAFDGFDAKKISCYTEEKCRQLQTDAAIIRNKRKIAATVENAKIFLQIQKEWNGFFRYLWSWTGGKTIVERGCTNSRLSDMISADLKKRGMKFMGTTIVYAYLQAVGIIFSHDLDCFLSQNNQSI